MQRKPKPEQGYGALAAAIANNEPWALEQIYRENYPAVEAYVLKNNGTRDDAKDLFQDSVIVVWQKIRERSFVDQKATAIGGFIFQIARFKWLDKLKSARHKVTVSMEVVPLIQDEQARDPDLLKEDCEKAEVAEKVSEQVAKLGDKCKKLLQAFYFEKLSMKDIGEKFGYEAESVRTLKYRCMQKLRQFYQDNK